MRIFGVNTLVIALALCATTLTAQTGYRPGQTYNTGQATPVPYAPPVSQQAPVYRQPVATPAATPIVRSTPAARSTQAPLYNLTDTKPASAPKAEGTPAKPRATSAPTKTTVKSTAIEAIERKRSEDKPKTEATKPTAAPQSNKDLVFSSRRTGKKWIALTYDDGPHGDYTRQLLKYLKDNNVPATFYLQGKMIKANPALTKEIADMGFELGNHSYDHPILSNRSRAQIVQQLQDTHDLMKEHAGVDVKTMRPPYGALNDTVRSVCQSMGYKIILWDVDTEDWRGNSADRMMNTITKLTRDGSIILMHDRKHKGQDTIIETTRRTVEKYRAEGYTFVTVSQLLELESDAAATPATAAAPAATPAPASSQVETLLPVPAAPAAATETDSQ